MTTSDVRQVWFTGDLITPDGSDTGVYGDPCEEGAGAQLESGWVSPDWSRFCVWEDRENVRPDTMDADDERSPVQWLVDTLNERLYVVESYNGRETFYSSQAEENYSTGESITLAAHAEGFTEDELRQVADMIGAR